MIMSRRSVHANGPVSTDLGPFLASEVCCLFLGGCESQSQFPRPASTFFLALTRTPHTTHIVKTSTKTPSAPNTAKSLSPQKQSTARPASKTADMTQFLDIPPELRLLIYDYLFEVPQELPLKALQHGADFIANQGILLVCRKTREEAVDMYRNICRRALKETTFTVDRAQKNDISSVSEAALARVASVALLFNDRYGPKRLILVQNHEADLDVSSSQWWTVTKLTNSVSNTYRLMEYIELYIRHEMLEHGQMSEEREYERAGKTEWVQDMRKHELMLYASHLPWSMPKRGRVIIRKGR